MSSLILDQNQLIASRLPSIEQLKQQLKQFQSWSHILKLDLLFCGWQTAKSAFYAAKISCHRTLVKSVSSDVRRQEQEMRFSNAEKYDRICWTWSSFIQIHLFQKWFHFRLPLLTWHLIQNFSVPKLLCSKVNPKISNWTPNYSADLATLKSEPFFEFNARTKVVRNSRNSEWTCNPLMEMYSNFFRCAETLISSATLADIIPLTTTLHLGSFEA